MPTNFLSSPCISLLILLLVMRAYICVVSILVCPNILLTVSMGTPLASVVVVANVCLARWNIQGEASKSGQVKIKRKSFEMSDISVFSQVEKMQTTTEY